MLNQMPATVAATRTRGGMRSSSRDTGGILQPTGSGAPQRTRAAAGRINLARVQPGDGLRNCWLAGVRRCPAQLPSARSRPRREPTSACTACSSQAGSDSSLRQARRPAPLQLSTASLVCRLPPGQSSAQRRLFIDSHEHSQTDTRLPARRPGSAGWCTRRARDRRVGPRGIGRRARRTMASPPDASPSRS